MEVNLGFIFPVYGSCVQTRIPSFVAKTTCNSLIVHTQSDLLLGSSRCSLRSLRNLSMNVSKDQDVLKFERLKDGCITSAKGFSAVGSCAGLKTSGKDDMCLIVCTESEPAAAGGVFTKSVVRAAPVDICRNQLELSGNRAAAIVINSGQANAATGEQGWKDALDVIELAASLIGVDPKYILVSSTGVIGRRIKMDALTKALPRIVSELGSSVESGLRAARAIMTTDLVPKTVGFQTEIGGKKVIVGGMAKGSGMIHPDMATMLSYITCDVGMDGKEWQKLVADAATLSFNQITVDGDTSTNDTLIGLASGASGAWVEPGTPEMETVKAMVTECCQYLAKSIARDGEGSTILLEVEVSGADSDANACKIAKTVCGSSLFKAAVFGRDPNWGRIAAAAGRAGVSFDQNLMSIKLGPIQLMDRGTPLSFDEKAASKYIVAASEAEYLSGKDTVRVEINLGSGTGKGTAWGCDLSYDYVKINAEYTT